MICYLLTYNENILLLIILFALFTYYWRLQSCYVNSSKETFQRIIGDLKGIIVGQRSVLLKCSRLGKSLIIKFNPYNSRTARQYFSPHCVQTIHLSRNRRQINVRKRQCRQIIYKFVSTLIPWTWMRFILWYRC